MGRHRHCASCWRTAGQTQGRGTAVPGHRAGDSWISVYMVVLRIGDAAEYSGFSLGDAAEPLDW
jgi:hypothetical protein